MKRLMTFITTLLLITATSLAATQSAVAEATSQTRARFFAGHPQAQGELLAESRLDASSRVDLSGATHVVLETAGEAYTFALVEARTALSESRAALNATHKRLAEIAAQLHAAIQGDTELVLFSDGEMTSGTIVAMHTLGRDAQADTRLGAEGATHLDLWQNGDVRTLRVSALADTLAEVQVTSTQASDSDAEGESQSLLKLSAALHAEVQAEGEMSSDADHDDDDHGDDDDTSHDDDDDDDESNGLGLGLELNLGDDD